MGGRGGFLLVLWAILVHRTLPLISESCVSTPISSSGGVGGQLICDSKWLGDQPHFRSLLPIRTPFLLCAISGAFRHDTNFLDKLCRFRYPLSYDRTLPMILTRTLRFPTDNPLHLPMLDPAMQPLAYTAPMRTWGNSSRPSLWPGTTNFYTDDQRFTALKKHPDFFLRSGCHFAIEPNFSTYADVDFFYNFEAIYWKRRIARYWQTQGISIFADLHVQPSCRELNFMGIPPSYRAFANRGNPSELAWLLDDYQAAQAHTGVETLLYLVFGGGPKVQAFCAEHHWLWVENVRG